MRQGFLIGLGSGLVSALLFFSAARGGPFLGHMLFFLTPLPPLLAGLGWGWLPAVAAALAGTLAVGAAATTSEGIGYFFAVGIPAAFIAYLAYLSRPSACDPDVREWYPVGRLLAALSLYASALPVLALPLIGGSYEFLRPMAAELFKVVFTRSSGPEAPSDQQIEALADIVVAAAPGAIAVDWLIIMVPNLYLAGRIAGASGHLARDWPDLSALAYPTGFSLLLAVAVAGTFAPGVIGIAGASFTGGLLFAHLLAGLAFMHFLARRGARWLLWVVYAGLLVPFFTPYAAIFITAAGIVEVALKLKQRLGAPPPST